MNNYSWNFSVRKDPGRDLIDPFSESKFNTNCISSFTREIIQNSLDARNPEISEPALVKFEIKSVPANTIPGIEKLKEVVGNCLGDVLEHKETRRKFEKALEELNGTTIDVLKVSDYNTKGMDLDAWKALLFFTGISKKQNDSSAGRHGVGKKASFIMSLCNTVFYSTQNEKDVYFGGKSELIDFYDINGICHNGTGWFSPSENSDQNSAYLANDQLTQIDEYFWRKNERGTDVIILLPRKNDEEGNLEKQIINSVLENFYVGIVENKLKVEFNDVSINATSIKNVIKKYYIADFKGYTLTDSNLIYGLLNDYELAYQESINSPERIEIKALNGYIDLYLSTNNEKSKKFCAFYRGHGMKIKDIRYGDANKFFSAIAVARGEELNNFLLGLENAAHDDFIIDDNLDKETKTDYENKKSIIFDLLKNAIIKRTKIEYSDEMELEELNEMMDNPGEIYRKSDKKKPEIKKPHKKMMIQTMTSNQTEEQWKEPIEPFKPKNYTVNPKPNDNDNRPIPYDIDTGDPGNDKKMAIREVKFEQLLITLQGSYYMDFMCKFDLKDVSIKVDAKNLDDGISDVSYMLDYIKWGDKIYKSHSNNFIKLGDLPANTHMKLNIVLKDQSRYKLFAKIAGRVYE